MRPRNIKPEILSLHEQGFNYTQIQEKLQCSKATISYHLGEGRKEKVLANTRRLRAENPMSRKINTFINLSYRQRHSLNSRIRGFHTINGHNDPENRRERTFTGEEIIRKYNGKCYLTGRTIDFSDINSYALDHIIPRSKGGPLTLENCGLTCKHANSAKSDMSLEEFFKLCVEVVKHNKLSLD
jgi:5-methylcytosine-specific restriction endonuclease McrA